MAITLPHDWAPRSYQLPLWRYLEGGGTHRFQGDSGASEEQLLICWALCNFEDNHDENAKEVIGIALRNGSKVLCDCNEAFIEYVPPED